MGYIVETAAISPATGETAWSPVWPRDLESPRIEDEGDARLVRDTAIIVRGLAVEDVRIRVVA